MINIKNKSILIKNLIAHRGLHNEFIPENSLMAFFNASKNNYSVELDVHITKDNVIVVFHDYNLKRVCGVNKLIESCSYNELCKYNLFKTKYKIPKLNDVLNMIDKNILILIEIKTLSFDEKIEKELSKILDNYNGLFAVQSFNIKSIKWFKKYRPKYLRGIIYDDIGISKINFLSRIKNYIFNKYLNVDFISYNVNDIDSFYVRNLRNKKIIISWTINNKSDYKKALKFSDNMIFDKLFV